MNILREMASQLTFGGDTAQNVSRDEVHRLAELRVHHASESSALTEVVLASPVLVGEANRYSFAHRSVQEVFAARAVANAADPLISICRIAIRLSRSMLEALAMTFDLVERTDEAFARIESLPDSVDLLLLGLRARAFRHTRTSIAPRARISSESRPTWCTWQPIRSLGRWRW